MAWRRRPTTRLRRRRRGGSGRAPGRRDERADSRPDRGIELSQGGADLDHSSLVKALELMAGHAVADDPAQG